MRNDSKDPGEAIVSFARTNSNCLRAEEAVLSACKNTGGGPNVSGTCAMPSDCHNIRS
jgi:hypothetical protein